MLKSTKKAIRSRRTDSKYRNALLLKSTHRLNLKIQPFILSIDNIYNFKQTDIVSFIDALPIDIYCHYDIIILTFAVNIPETIRHYVVRGSSL